MTELSMSAGNRCITTVQACFMSPNFWGNSRSYQEKFLQLSKSPDYLLCLPYCLDSQSSTSIKGLSSYDRQIHLCSFVCLLINECCCCYAWTTFSPLALIAQLVKCRPSEQKVPSSNPHWGAEKFSIFVFLSFVYCSIDTQ